MLGCVVTWMLTAVLSLTEWGSGVGLDWIGSARRRGVWSSQYQNTRHVGRVMGVREGRGWRAGALNDDLLPEVAQCPSPADRCYAGQAVKARFPSPRAAC